MDVKRIAIPGWSRILILTLATLVAAQRDAVLLPPEDFDLHSLPFEEGEEVKYSIYWKPIFLFPSFKAGEVRLTIDRTQIEEEPAFRISAWATSDGLLKSVAGLDVRDYFESIVEARSFRSKRFLYQRRQNEKRRNLEVLIDYADDQLLLREVDVSVDPPRVIRNRRDNGLPPAVLDSLSVFYAARLREMRTGDRFRLFLSDSGNIKPVNLEVVKAETLNIALGDYDTVKISTAGGIFREGGDFRIWYTRDRLRIPVKFEADVKFGKVFGELIHLQTPQRIKSRIRVP